MASVEGLADRLQPCHALEETLSTSQGIPVAEKRPKLHGRAFYESIGAPKMILAPMVDQSEYAWRLLTRSYMPQSNSPLLAYTPMLHARLFATVPKYRDASFQPLRTPLSSVSPSTLASPSITHHLDGNPVNDRPLFTQFCANNPETFLSAARHVAPFCDAVDLNLGCPQGIAKKGHYGAFLQEDPELIYQMINLLHRELPIPVTAKIRVLDTKEDTLAYARRVLEAGASILTVHGRRREQKGHATGMADWSYIRYLRENLPSETVIFANGNILGYADLQKCLEATGADGVMSAEGNLADPAIFAPPPEIGQDGREYWRGADGKGGYRMDGVMRRYLDIIYRHVLGVAPPQRQALFVPDDRPLDGEQQEHIQPTTELEHEDAPAAKRQRLGPPITTFDAVPASETAAVTPSTTAPLPSTASTQTDAPSQSLTKNQLKKKLKNQLKRHKRTLPPTTDPSLTAMQPHLFHLLRPLITRYTNIRDTLARCRPGDLEAYEYVLVLVEEVTRQGLLGLLPEEDQAKQEHLAQPDQAVEAGDSSLFAANECRRPVWICQSRVRPSPKEAIEKGGLTLSKKRAENMEEEVVLKVAATAVRISPSGAVVEISTEAPQVASNGHEKLTAEGKREELVCG